MTLNRSMRAGVVALGVVATMVAWTLHVEAESTAPVQMSVWIAGDDEIPPDEDCGWTAVANNGTSPYSYKWWGGLTGTTQSIIGSLHASSWLWVEIRDSATPAAVDTASIFVTVDDGYTCTW